MSIPSESAGDLEIEFDPFEGRPRDECGVFGVFGHAEAGVLTALGLHALQHRGQEGCGIVSFDGELFHHERHLGLVGDNLTGADLPKRVPGHAAVGHTRYSTQGGAILRNVQPLFADLQFGGVAIAHNGNLTNARLLREELVRDGAIFQSTSDTETILQLIARSRAGKMMDRFIQALRQIEGAYALVALSNKKLIGARDPLGIRPLILGEVGGCPVLASESCALDIIGGEYVRDVEPGEIVVISADGIESIKPFPPMRARPCIFEYVYFARPDSVVNGLSIYEVRRSMGQTLAAECPINADVVVPVPDSGVPAALGYAEASGIPFQLGIIRNHYVGRTFIQPSQQRRTAGVRMKLSANRSQITGKRVILVDDSIVRGTTSAKIVQMVRDAGAKEVHLLSASPPIMWPDYYGIDTPERENLLAATHTLKQMEQKLGVDSLGFLSVNGLYRAMGQEARDDEHPQYTDHYFTGDYPTRLVDRASDRADKDRQLSFLVEA
ncbi:MAG: amidophosphoribosyltransferase [Caulobacterales bacterium]